MAITKVAPAWHYFPTLTEWDETEGTERIRRCAALLTDALDRHDTPMTERTRIALYHMKRALLQENS